MYFAVCGVNISHDQEFTGRFVVFADIFVVFEDISAVAVRIGIAKHGEGARAAVGKGSVDPGVMCCGILCDTENIIFHYQFAAHDPGILLLRAFRTDVHQAAENITVLCHVDIDGVIGEPQRTVGDLRFRAGIQQTAVERCVEIRFRFKMQIEIVDMQIHRIHQHGVFRIDVKTAHSGIFTAVHIHIRAVFKVQCSSRTCNKVRGIHVQSVKIGFRTWPRGGIMDRIKIHHRSIRKTQRYAAVGVAVDLDHTALYGGKVFHTQ